MIRASDLVIDTKKTLGEILLLTEITEIKSKKDGKNTEEVEGYRYYVASEALNLEKIGVKIPGKMQIEKPVGIERVSFEGMTITPYIIDGKLVISATATGIAVVKKQNEMKT